MGQAGIPTNTVIQKTTVMPHPAHQVACEASLEPDVRQNDIWHLFMARTYFYLLMGGKIESAPGHPNSKLISSFSASTHEQTAQTL